MEADEPSSVQAIYERIVRRESLAFLSYRRPFRAITLAMSLLVRRGEACLVLAEDKSSLLRHGHRRYWVRPCPSVAEPILPVFDNSRK